MGARQNNDDEDDHGDELGKDDELGTDDELGKDDEDVAVFVGEKLDKDNEIADGDLLSLSG